MMTGEGCITVKMYFAPEFCGNFVALPSPRSGLLTADKREIKDFPKLPSATSFIRKTLGEMLARHYRAFLNYINY